MGNTVSPTIEAALLNMVDPDAKGTLVSPQDDNYICNHPLKESCLECEEEMKKGRKDLGKCNFECPSPR